MRVVIDTNVLLSATFWTGKPKQLLNKVRRREITFLTSEILLSELKEVLVRQDKPFKLSENEAERILKALREIAEIVRTDSQVTICEDDSDNRVLECATDGSTECIITGDVHLLSLRDFQGTKIVTVREFLGSFAPR